MSVKQNSATIAQHEHRDRGGRSAKLFCRCEADSLLAEVVSSEVAAEEDVTDDEERVRSRDIESGEGGYARSLNLKDVVRGAERVLLSVKGEGEVWEAGDLFAVDGVLSLPSLLCTDCLVKNLCRIGWHGDEGRTGVDGGACRVKL